MSNQSRCGRGIELVSGLGFEDIRVRLLEIGARDESLNRALSFYLSDIAARKNYEDGGFSSAAHFAEAQLEIPQRRARELVRVGTELHHLNLVDDAFFAMEIGWTKVLYLLRVVQVTTQAPWVEFAKDASCRELQDEVKRCRPGELPGQGTRIGISTKLEDVHASLDARTYAMFERARTSIRESSGCKEVSDSEVIEEMIKEFVANRPELDTFEEAEESLPYEERNRDELPAQTRELVISRDDHRCRSCNSANSLHAHHIIFREFGGSNDPSNLLSLCATCHSMIHRRKLIIYAHPSDPSKFIFTAANKTPVTRRLTLQPLALPTLDRREHQSHNHRSSFPTNHQKPNPSP